jgi:hypothetical protein
MSLSPGKRQAPPTIPGRKRQVVRGLKICKASKASTKELKIISNVICKKIQRICFKCFARKA